MYFIDECIIVFLNIFTTIIETTEDPEVKQNYKSAKFWTETRKNGNACLECYVQEMLRCGQQHLLRKVWLPVKLAADVDNYHKNLWLLKSSIYSLFHRNSAVTTWCNYFVNGEIPIGYFVSKVLLYGEESKLLQIMDQLPKSQRRRLMKSKKNIFRHNHECFICNDPVYS